MTKEEIVEILGVKVEKISLTENNICIRDIEFKVTEKLEIKSDISKNFELIITKSNKYEKYDFIFRSKIAKNNPKNILLQCSFSNKIKLIDLKFNKDNIEEITISNATIKKLNLSEMTIAGKVKFDGCVFENEDKNEKNFNFSNAIFKSEVNFNNSTFKDFADFHTSTFEKLLDLHGVRFESTPNFSGADFKENTIFTNTGFKSIDDFEALEKDIAIESKRRKSRGKPASSQSQVAQNFRASFSNIKNHLLKNNNPLEAEKYHKAELYCKEIELYCQDNKIKIDEENNKEENNKQSTKDYFDYLILKIYRNTSDHHSDFLKILNFTIFCMIIYAVLAYLLYLATSDTKLNFTNSDGIKDIIIIGFVILAFLSPFYFLLKTPLKFKLIIFIFFIFFVAFVILTMTKYTPLEKISYTLAIAFAGLYFALICFFIFYFTKFHSKFLMFIIYSLFVVLLAAYPRFINPFVGVFKSDSLITENFLDKELNEINASLILSIANTLQKSDFNDTGFAQISSAKNIIKERITQYNGNDKKIIELKNIYENQQILEKTIKSSSILYSLILILCLYSLTKTARKNSVLPI